MMTALAVLWTLWLVRRIVRVRHDVWRHTRVPGAPLSTNDGGSLTELYARLYVHPPPARDADTPVRPSRGPYRPADEAPVRLAQDDLRTSHAAPGPPRWREHPRYWGISA